MATLLSTHMQNKAINLSDKLSAFNEHWSPRTVGTFNGHDLMVVKVKGEFVWHTHADTDDFFLVLVGELKVQMRDRTVELNAGDMYVVPKGVEHRTVADEEAHLFLIEPTGTPNTGSVETAAARTLA
jgi:mannose-6-phosphate isomerase-like protein (cupin superfamily)